MTTALVLSGGGARAAYQVGVLKAVAELLPRRTHNPFPIVCGTSAGAINALAVAGRPGFLRQRVSKLENIWGTLRAENVYRTDLPGVIRNTSCLIWSLFHSGYSKHRALALLDNSPLRELLKQLVRFRYIDEAIARGELTAVSATAMDYGTGRSVTFFQGRHDTWERSRRLGIRCGLTIDHLLASSAIPTIFPATSIDDSYYGDGAVRQLKPLSPAL
ncbi:MAG TPA: patatin, partial [Porticoccaceae bacterium]|nr:patatin [Porticoccaceae bacterium]